MTHFIFCHGFGFDRNFWEPLAPYFAHEKSSFIDLGYFNNPLDAMHLPEEPVIGIGHSIGLSKLIAGYDNFTALIGLNGFINFLGAKQDIRITRQKELQALRLRFGRDAKSALRNFYATCGVPEFTNITKGLELNMAPILSDFDWLQREYHLPENDQGPVPALILAADDDIIVPSCITGDNFAWQQHVQIQYIADCGHCLGFKKPLEVYEKIMSFLDGATA
jgi:pimeloyl-[acyl-carrier protein] methyl ester esterase